jgi:hypothetical protein
MMATPLQNHRVLYVDDHADTVEMVTLMLEAGGFGYCRDRMSKTD